MLCRFLMATSLAFNQVMLPEQDQDGRRQTLNGYGFGDTRMNATQLQFIGRAAYETTKTVTEGERIPIALDIGGGFGDVAFRILDRGGNVLFMDSSEEHAEIVKTLYEALPQKPKGTLEVLAGSLPYAVFRGRNTKNHLEELQKRYKIVVMGSFSMFMYLSELGTLEMLKWAYETLPSKGRFYITGISPYCNLFPHFEAHYLKRLEEFRRDPAIRPFPGWIPDVDANDMTSFVPNNYSQMYPPFFHLMEPEVLKYHSEKLGFRVVEARFLRRNYPERLRYRGSLENVGELASVILEKP